MLKETDTEQGDQFNNSISKHNKLHYSKQDPKMKGTARSVECCLALANLVIVNVRAENGSGKFLTIRHNEDLD